VLVVEKVREQFLVTFGEGVVLDAEADTGCVDDHQVIAKDTKNFHASLIVEYIEFLRSRHSAILGQ
jgi:hypothetical protein